MNRARVPVSMHSRRFLASVGERAGVALLVTTCFGPRSAAVGLTGRTWARSSQSQAMRIAPRCCFTVGRGPGWIRMYAVTWSDEMGSTGSPRVSHQPRSCLAVVAAAATVLAFPVGPAKNSRSLRTAAGPVSTISPGQPVAPDLSGVTTDVVSAAASSDGLSVTDTMASVIWSPSFAPPSTSLPPSTNASNRSQSFTRACAKAKSPSAASFAPADRTAIAPLSTVMPSGTFANSPPRRSTGSFTRRSGRQFWRRALCLGRCDENLDPPPDSVRVLRGQEDIPLDVGGA